MKTIKIVSGFLIFLTIGCLSSQPEIEDRYITEMTPEQSKLLEKIQKDIIAKKSEKDKTETELAIAEYTIEVSKLRIEALEKIYALKIKEQNLFEMKKDNAKASETKLKIEEYNRKLQFQKKKHDYNIAYRDNTRAILVLNIAEMASLIASLNYEKAKIGVENKKKRAPIIENKKDGTMKGGDTVQSGGNGIDIKKFEEYLKKKQTVVMEKKSKQLQASEKFSLAAKIINDFGFKGEEL